MKLLLSDGAHWEMSQQRINELPAIRRKHEPIWPRRGRADPAPATIFFGIFWHIILFQCFPCYIAQQINQKRLTVCDMRGPDLFMLSGRAFLNTALDLIGAAGSAAAPVAFFAFSE